jgi:hypothetical protein
MYCQRHHRLNCTYCGQQEDSGFIAHDLVTGIIDQSVIDAASGPPDPALGSSDGYSDSGYSSSDSGFSSSDSGGTSDGGGGGGDW